MSSDNRLLLSSIQSGNYRQALIKINKELKKSPSSAYYLALKGYVLVLQNNVDEGLSYSDKVANLGIRNSQIMLILQDTYRYVGRHDKLQTYFEAVAKNNPKDEQFLKDIWFSTMVAVGDHVGQQKAAMALSKLGDRKYSLWAIASIFMTLRCSSASETEKKLFPLLSLRLLAKVEPMESPQEAYLKVLIYQLNNKRQEIIDYLQSEQVQKWDSLDLNTVLYQTLLESQNWGGLKEQCIRILKDLARDDFNHWKALIQAAINLDEIQFVYDFISSYKIGQNSKLALVHLASELVTLRENADFVPSLNDTVESYFTFMGDKRSVFNDLKLYISTESFDKKRWLEFLDGVEAKKNQQNITVNIEKFRFLFRPEEYDVNALVQNQVRLYNKSKVFLKKKDAKDYHPGDDHLLIAASALLETSTDTTSLKKAAVLLETATSNDTHQFYVRLWLVRIYLLLGAFTKAHQHYSVLRVQNLQVESMSHFIITRSTSLYPSETPLTKVLESYQNFSEEIINGLLKIYNQGVYTQLESFVHLRETVDNSMTKSILGVQVSKLVRYTSSKTFNSDILKYVDMNKLEDNRDFEIMWDIPRPGTERLSYHATLGPKVKSHWVKIHEVKNDIIKSLVKSDKLSDLSTSLEKLLAEGALELTDAEKWSCRVLLLLSESAQDKMNPSKYDLVSKQLSSLQFPETQGWPSIHTLFEAVEVSLVINNYAFNLHSHRNQVKYNSQEVEGLKTAAAELSKSAKDVALKMKDSRIENTRVDIENLKAWSQEANLGLDSIEDVIDGLYYSYDESLTLVRTAKV